MKPFQHIRDFLQAIRVPLCGRCGHPILMTHRFRLVHHRFLFFRWDTFEHRHCHHPHLDPVVSHRAFSKRYSE